jgi:hypothetical protein
VSRRQALGQKLWHNTVGYVRELSSVPVWLVALVVAVVAPGAVRLLHGVFERRLRVRTLDTIAMAISTSCDGPEIGAHTTEQRHESERDVAS